MCRRRTCWVWLVSFGGNPDSSRPTAPIDRGGPNLDGRANVQLGASATDQSAAERRPGSNADPSGSPVRPHKLSCQRVDLVPGLLRASGSANCPSNGSRQPLIVYAKTTDGRVRSESALSQGRARCSSLAKSWPPRSARGAGSSSSSYGRAEVETPSGSRRSAARAFLGRRGGSGPGIPRSPSRRCAVEARRRPAGQTRPSDAAVLYRGPASRPLRKSCVIWATRMPGITRSRLSRLRSMIHITLPRPCPTATASQT